MRIATVMQDDMQVERTSGRNGSPEFFAEGGVKGAERFVDHVRVPDEEGAAAEIDGGRDECFVHRHGCGTVATDAALVAQRLEKSLAEANADIFHGVVGVDVQVASAFHAQVEQAVLGDVREHVIEKAYAGGEVELARPIEIEGQVDLCLVGFAIDRCGAWHNVRSTRWVKR